jgi:4-amino-4-deoxy-L-arabinose transferase-like glycosyltransferase
MLAASPSHRAPRGVLLLALAVILAAALLIRLWDINRESFWADEGWTMILAHGPELGGVVRTMADDQHPPLYFALLHYWMAAFGESETMIRLLSAFWSLVGVAVVYRLGADLFSPGAGLAAALLLALMDNDIMLAREARHYAQMATLVSFSALFYLRYLRRQSMMNGIGWLLASVALMYTHYLGALALAVQGMHALIYARPARRLIDVLFRLALVGVAWLPWALVFVGQSLVRYTRPILYQSTMPNTPETFAIVRGDLVGSHYGLTVGLLLLGLLYVTYRSGVPAVAWRPSRPTAYLALWVGLPIAAIVLLNERFPILTTRNFLIVTPAITLLIGHGLMNLDRAARTFLLAVLVVVGLFSVDAYHLKPPYRDIAQELVSLRAADEPILLDVWTDSFALRYHLGRAAGSDPDTLPLILLPEWREQYGELFYAHLLESLQGGSAFWLAYWGPEENVLFDFFGTHGFVRSATLTAYHLDNAIYVYRYDRSEGAPIAQFGYLFGLRWAHVIRTGDAVRVNLLWEALAQTSYDYSISAFVLAADGQLIGQHDGPPLDGRALTSGWRTGDLRFDSHTIPLVGPLSPGTLTVGVRVYWYADPTPLPVRGGSAPDYFTAGEFEVSPGS